MRAEPPSASAAHQILARQDAVVAAIVDLRDSVLVHALHGLMLPSPGAEDAERRSSEVGFLPHGWTVAAYGDLCDAVITGPSESPPTGKGGPPLVGADEVAEHGLRILAAPRVARRAFDALAAKYRAAPGDVLLVRDRRPGRVALVEEPMAFTSEVALLRPGSRITARFLAWSLRSPELHRELLGDPDDPRFRHLPVGRLARRQLGVPPPAEQEEITDLLDAIERRLLVAEARREETAAHLAAVSD